MRLTLTSPIIALLILLFLGGACSLADTESHSASTESVRFPRPVGYINDFAEMLTAEQEQTLTDIVTAHETQTTDQIAVVTVDSIAPYDNIADYAIDLANDWSVGQKKQNNGMLIVIAKDLRGIRIENGYGIEKRLTDPETKRIMAEKIVPEFKKEGYFEGLRKGILAIIEELR